MKKCLICGREVVSKRKDAKYCKDAACRKKAHQTRKEQGKTALPRSGENKAAVVLTFPDGSRWLMELTPLRPTNAARLPSLAQMNAATHENGSGSDPAPATAAVEVLPLPLNAPPEISSEQIQLVAATSPAESFPQEPTTADEHPLNALQPGPADGCPSSGAPALAPSRPQAVLRTVELFFTDLNGRRLLFHEAVESHASGDWRVRRGTRVTIGLSQADGCELAGSPGRWHDFYPGQSPSEFGLDSDLAVLHDVGEDGQVYVVSPKLLSGLLGAEWRARLREIADGQGAVHLQG